VPLRMGRAGLNRAEAFPLWPAAPLAEGSLRNSSARDPSTRERPQPQTALLLAVTSALLVIGIWTRLMGSLSQDVLRPRHWPGRPHPEAGRTPAGADRRCVPR